MGPVVYGSDPGETFLGRDVGQHGGLLVSHAAQVDGHEKRRHLVVGHIACHIAVDGEGQFFMVQRTAVALLGDNIVHSHSFFSL